MSERMPKNIFVNGPIDPAFIAASIEKHQSKRAIGGHSIFLGQVRADKMGEQTVTAIEYTAYEEVAIEKMHEIREAVIASHSLTCLHVHHSLGRVEAGQICLFVFASAPHRKAAIDGCEETVERLKAELPVWGRELFDDNTHQWKVNT